jgi:uncharacterized protein (TIGR03437 family)
VGGNSNFTVYLEVQAASPTLLVKGGLNVLNPVAYLTGAAAPTLALTLESSSGLPIAFSVAAVSNATPGGVTGGTAPVGWLTINAGSASGIAYSWGTTIYLTASANALNANPGDYLTGTITITAGGAGTVVPLNIAVAAAAPTVTSLSPSLVPLLVSPVAPGFVNVVIKGTNFVATTGSQKTKVFVGANLAGAAQILTDNVTVLSPNYLTVAIPYAANGAPFATAGATAVLIGVANGANPAAPVSSMTIGVTSAPIISTITSASAFIVAAAGTNPSVAPYDIVTIFGSNLCPLCTGTNSLQVAAPDAVFLRYPTFLSPDGSHKVTVTFSKPGTPATNLPGYLLFATNNQVNVAVPGNLTSLQGTGANAGLVNVNVGYDTATPATAANSSVAFPVAYAFQDPGIFTIGSDGQGQGAITDATTFVLNSQANYATGGADIVAIFMTGLGVPDSVVPNGTAPTNTVWSSDCIAPLGAAGTAAAFPTGYMGTVNTPVLGSPFTGSFAQAAGYAVPAPLWTSIDGAIINVNELTTGIGAPCFLEADTAASGASAVITVTIGGNAYTAVSSNAIGFAGMVAGSIAGLYQINVPIPTGIGNGTSAAQFPVTVTMGSGGTAITSQAGVTMWIK